MRYLIFFLLFFTTEALFAQDGILDITFNSNGRALASFDVFDSSVHSLALQDDGKIIAGGTVFNEGNFSQFGLARFNSDGTPDFTFEVDENFTKPFLSETDLLGLYMSAIAKFALEHRQLASDINSVNLGAAKMIVDYSNKPSNNLKQTGELKKMATALKKGELEKYFGI